MNLDGTVVRYCTYVLDVVEGYVVDLDKLKEGVNIYNLWLGKVQMLYS